MAVTQDETRQLVALLGGPALFQGEIKDAKGLQEALRVGFPFAAFESVVEVLELSSKDLAHVLGVATRTLARRKASKRLSPIESDRLYRVAHSTWLAATVLGSLDKARSWLRRPNQALGGECPINLLDTEIGERAVEEVLNRISFGVLS